MPPSPPSPSLRPPASLTSSSTASSTIATVSLDHLLYFFVFADINTLGFFSSTSIGPPPDSHPSHRQRYRRRPTSESEGLKTYSDQACDQVFSPVVDLLYAPDIADPLMLHNFSRD
ncbi:hypothetical protein L2E82_20540 [Cichorium intybus]|uniref:Uncharacterized protein n=1 Tax=Cichorium intybus TaxID=13427 RepID=A0ACB9DT67_CICIN|nr:hypothetical protein L2E82_20540 [Cichorium intybus]